MTHLSEPKQPALRSVYWREEILELVLWLRGEGLADRLDEALLRRFLDMDGETAAAHLHRLSAQGYLEPVAGAGYRLSAQGELEAQRLLEGARSVPTSAAGGCGPECWCATSPIEASLCAAQ